jgi:hypothetical protein
MYTFDNMLYQHAVTTKLTAAAAAGGRGRRTSTQRRQAQAELLSRLKGNGALLQSNAPVRKARWRWLADGNRDPPPVLILQGIG